MTGTQMSHDPEQILAKKLTRRSFLAIIGLGAGASLLAACSPAPSASGPAPTQGSAAPAQGKAPVTISFASWAYAEETTRKSLDTVTAEFQKTNPDITVKHIPIPFVDMPNQMVIQIAGGNPPDVVQTSGSTPFAWTAMGALEPLDSLLQKQQIDDYWPGTLAGGQYDKQTIAIPWSITPHGFWYNRDLMAKAGLDPNKPPKTMDDFNAALKQTREKLPADVVPFLLDTKKETYALVNQWPWILQFGIDPLADNKPNFDNPQMRAYFAWLRDMVLQKQMPVNMKLTDSRQFSALDREVFCWDGPYFKGTVQGINTSLTDDAFYKKWGVTAIPTAAGQKPQTALDIHQLAMMKASKNKEAAWKYMQYLSFSDLAVTNYFIPLGALPPARSSVDKFKDKFSNPVSQAFINEILPNVVPIPYGPKYPSADPFIQVAIQEVTSTNKPIDQILQELQANLKVVYGV